MMENMTEGGFHGKFWRSQVPQLLAEIYRPRRRIYQWLEGESRYWRHVGQYSTVGGKIRAICIIG
jgi:hypothetical protein